jgi:hypothetical protein
MVKLTDVIAVAAERVRRLKKQKAQAAPRRKEGM